GHTIAQSRPTAKYRGPDSIRSSHSRYLLRLRLPLPLSSAPQPIVPLTLPQPPVVSFFGMAMCIQPGQQSAYAAVRQGDTRIRGAIVKIDGVSILRHGIAARENHVLNIPMPFVVRLWGEHPGIATNQTTFGLLKIKEGQTKPIDGT